MKKSDVKKVKIKDVKTTTSFEYESMNHEK